MRAARDDQNKRIKVNNFRFYNRLLALRPDAGKLGSYFLRTTAVLFTPGVVGLTAWV